MARGQVGNQIGLAARGKSSNSLATVTANAGSSTVALTSDAELRRFKIGDAITFLTAAGATRLAGRTVTGLNLTGRLLVYSGADDATIAATDTICKAGDETASVSATATNVNGGPDFGRGFDMNGDAQSIDAARARLQAISGSTYTDTQLDAMTYNDMIYAIRLNDYPTSV